MTTPHRRRRRQLERQLVDLPTPPPPADLLGKIRDQIPADLLAGQAPNDAEGPATPWHRRSLLRLAASLAIVAAGLSLATRVLDRTHPEARPLAVTETELGANVVPGASNAAATPAPPASTEVSAEPRRVVREVEQKLDEALPSASSPPPTAVAELRRSKNELRQFLQAMAPDRPIADPKPPEVPSADAEALPKRSINEFRALGQPLVTDRAVALEAPPLERTPTVTDPYSVRQTVPRVQTDRISVAPPSTGGTAEPNDAAYGDMLFRGAGTNPFVDTAEDRLSTFALDVDTGSWTLARSYLDRGLLPPAEAIRVEEFVNAQPYADPGPRHGDFTLVAEGAPSPFAPPGNYRLVRVAVKGREIDSRDRRAANLTFVVDVSGSMRRENRLELVKRALHLLVTELGNDDRVALVVYGSRGRVVLRPTRDLDALRTAIDSLVPEGSTNAEEGLRLGYDLAGEMYRPDAANRVILCSDGVANVGATGPESILETIGRQARRGIELTAVGFGMGNYNDALMEQLADQGDGRYHYVDTLEEARRIFVEDLTGTLETIAEDAKIQVEFDPAAVERWRLLGYENRDIADRDFRNDAVDAGELGAGHSAVALYEIRLSHRARNRDRLATLRLRWQSTATRRIEEASLDLRLRDLESSFHRGSPDLRRATIAAEFAELLKGSYYAKEASWSLLVDEAYRLERDQADPRALRRLSDLTERIERAAQLAGEREHRAPESEED